MKGSVSVLTKPAAGARVANRAGLRSLADRGKSNAIRSLPFPETI